MNDLRCWLRACGAWASESNRVVNRTPEGCTAGLKDSTLNPRGDAQLTPEQEKPSQGRVEVCNEDAD